VTEQQSHFSHLDLLRHTAHAAAGHGVSGQAVEEYVALQILQSPKIEAIGELRGRQRYSTPEVLAQEETLLTLAKELAETASHRITLASLLLHLSLENARAIADWMTLDQAPASDKDQSQAIKSIAQESGQLAILSAPAGTARMQTITRLGRMYEAVGNAVLTASATGAGVRRLAEGTGLPAIPFRTLQNLAERDRSKVAGVQHAAKQLARQAVGRYIGLFPFRRQPLLDENVVVLVDAAERISTNEMSSLLESARHSGCKLVLIGSPDGLQSIERGIPFAAFLKRFQAAELTEIVHPEHPQDAKNIKRLQSGNTTDLLKDLDERGRLHRATSHESAEARLISLWQERGGTLHPHEHLIVAADERSAQRLNQLASEANRKTGLTREDDSVVLASGEKLFAGDRVLCQKTSRRYGILAGDMGTVIGVSRRLNSVQLEQDNGDRLTVPLTTYSDLTRGYAVTTWQARPTEHAYLLLSGASFEDRQSALTKLSQATESTHVFVDEQAAGPELRDLAQQLANDRKKTLAKDVQERLNDPELGEELP
jgi:hypothetical protein